MPVGKKKSDLRKKYESLTFKNDFMFGAVMSDPAIAKRVLEVILKEEIPDIENCELQKVVDNDPVSHGVRYDVYIKTNDNTQVYDIEMQTGDSDHLRKRSRYYQSSSDMDFLSKGEKYTNLPKSYVIFICDFDLFGKGKAVYQFQNYCAEEDVYLNDETYKIFLNTTGKTDREELRNLMTYIKTNIPNDDLTNDIQKKINDVQHSGKLYSSYIKEQQNAMILQDKARAEGEAKGRAEGKAEAIKQLLKKGLSTANIIDLFDLSKDEAKLYFGDTQTVRVV